VLRRVFYSFVDRPRGAARGKLVAASFYALWYIVKLGTIGIT
jgi:hypothetical protein